MIYVIVILLLILVLANDNARALLFGLSFLGLGLAITGAVLIAIVIGGVLIYQKSTDGHRITQSGTAKITAVQPASITQSQNNDFIFTVDTVTDTRTGLMWARNAGSVSTQMNWHKAIEWTRGLAIAGYHDWRLPTISELETITRYGGSKPDEYLNNLGFRVEGVAYWSSDTADTYKDYAKSMWMPDGSTGINFKNNQYVTVWPVRGVR